MPVNSEKEFGNQVEFLKVRLIHYDMERKSGNKILEKLEQTMCFE